MRMLLKLVLKVGWGEVSKRDSQFSYLNVRDVGLYFGSLLTHIVVNVLYLVSICHFYNLLRSYLDFLS